MAEDNSKVSVLFVCLGNICRSTMAEGVFRSLIKSDSRIGTVDSAGTGAYHTLDPPDYRTMATLRKHGISDYDHGARQVTDKDFDEFDYIFAMDSSNLQNLQRLQRRVDNKNEKSKAKVMLFGEFGGSARAEEVSDPYYGGNNGFDKVTFRPSQIQPGLKSKYSPDPPKTFPIPRFVPTNLATYHTVEKGFSSYTFWTIALILVCGSAAFVEYVTSGKEYSSEVTLSESDPIPETGSENFKESLSDEVISIADMPSPPGTLGNLTPEQEVKLKEFWALTLKTFGVEDPSPVNGRPTSIEIPHASDVETDKKTEKKGLFHRKHKNTGSVSGSSGGDTDDKYGQTKELQEILATQTPESLRSTFWSMVKLDHPDALLLRFLRARKWDVEKALAMMISTMKWRGKDMLVDEDIMKHGEGGALEDSKTSNAQLKKEGEDFLAQLRMGKSFLHGTDKENRPLCFVRVRLHKGGEQSERSLERYTVYLIETTRLALQSPVETATIVFDMTSFTMANMDYTPVKFMIKVFEANYPESLGTVIVHKSPWIFQSIWKIIRGWLDPVVASKVHFTNNVSDLEEFIPRSQIIKELGGDEAWEYKFVEPVPGENEALKDESTRKSIEDVRKKDVVEYQMKTFEWIHGSDVKADRDAIAQRLEKNYWQLDPYIRARSLYDRIGMFGKGGKINYYPSTTSTSSGTPNLPQTAEDDVD